MPTLDTCSITANVFYVDGTIGGSNIYLETKNVVLNDEVLAAFSKVFSASNGVLTLTLPQGATAKLRGTVEGFSDWITIAVPSAATANLVDLIAVASVPTTGIIVQDDGTPFVDKVGTFNLGAGLVATETSAGVARVDAIPAVNAQTGTTYSFQASDNGKIVTLNNANPITATVPAGLGAGFNCLVVQLGAGLVSFAASGVTLNNRQSFTDSAGQFAVMSLVAYAANIYALGGDLA